MDSLLVVTLGGHDVASHGPARSTGSEGSDGQALRAAIDLLRAKADVQVCPVTKPDDLDSALHRRGGRTLVLAGGDAALHTVVSALHKRQELDDAVLGILPTGTTHDFADGAGIPSRLDEAARVVLAGAQRRFDLLEDCRGDVAVNGAAVARTHPALAGLGELAGVEALTQLANRPLHVRVVADEQVVADFDRPVIGLDVNNCPTATRGHRQCPEADPSDGYADVVVSFAGGRMAPFRDVLGRNRRNHRSRHHLERADVLRIRARKVSVAGQWFSLATDGVDTGAEQRCTWTVLPHRLRVIVSAGHPES
ncbi:MAG TPA: diacylglycerol kinase family protein [Actinopolymorphaceae bacterium]